MIGDVHDGLSMSQMCGIRNRVAGSESGVPGPACAVWSHTGQLTAEASPEPAAAPRHKSEMRGRKGETGQEVARRRRRKEGDCKGCEC